MRVTFPRLPDRGRTYALVERDDGAVYRLYGGRAKSRLPHDIMHFVVERELHIPDSIWGGIASGIVFDSIKDPRQRPPSAARSGAVQGAAGQFPPARAARRGTGQLRRVRRRPRPSVGHADPDPGGHPAVGAPRGRRGHGGRPRSPRPRRPCRSRPLAGPGCGSGRNSATNGRAPHWRHGAGPGRVNHVSLGQVRKGRGAGRHDRTAGTEQGHRARPSDPAALRPDDLDNLVRAVDESEDHLRPWLPWVAGTGVGVIWRLVR